MSRKRTRKGFVLHMWTGLLPINANGQPVLFSSVDSALAHLSRCPSFGRKFVEVRECTVKYGESSNGLPDYHVGRAAAQGMSQ